MYYVQSVCMQSLYPSNMAVGWLSIDSALTCHLHRIWNVRLRAMGTHGQVTSMSTCVRIMGRRKTLNIRIRPSDEHVASLSE